MEKKNDTEIDNQRTLARFANSFDLKDWDLMEPVLTEVLTVDYSDLRGDPPKEITAKEYVAARREALQHLDTQHIIGNLEIEVAGGEASVRASSLILRSRDSKSFNTHASYLFGLTEAQSGDWRIARIKQTPLRNEGDPAIHSGARRTRA